MQRMRADSTTSSRTPVSAARAVSTASLRMRPSGGVFVGDGEPPREPAPGAVRGRLNDARGEAYENGVRRDTS